MITQDSTKRSSSTVAKLRGSSRRSRGVGSRRRISKVASRQRKLKTSPTLPSRKSRASCASGARPMHERLVLCGGAEYEGKRSKKALSLAILGSQSNIKLRLDDISRRMVTNVPDLLTDLVEIGTYV